MPTGVADLARGAGDSGTPIVGTPVRISYFLWGMVAGVLPPSLIVLCVGANTELPQEHSLQEVQIVAIKVGDTFEVRPLATETVRLNNADAWESCRRRQSVRVTDAEVRKGQAATQAVRELLLDKRVWFLQEGRRRDNYGRALGRLLVQNGDTTIDLGDWLKVHGHTRDSAQDH